MTETAATTAASVNRSSKNTTPTNRSSGTGSNTSTSTPSSRKKKSAGEQHEAGSGGIAGLFASLCGGSKAKRAFDDGGSAAAKNTTAKPTTTVRRPSQSKALPAAPVTTKEVASDVEVSTTKRLSTAEPGPSSRGEGTANGAIGGPNQSALANGDTAREAIGERANGNASSSASQHKVDDWRSGVQGTLGEDSGNERVKANSTESKSLAPIALGGGALALTTATLAVAENGSHHQTKNESRNSRDLTDQRQDVEAVTQQFDKIVLPNDALVSTGHPLPLDEVSFSQTLPSSCSSSLWLQTEGMTSAAVQPPGSGPTFVPATGPHAHHHHLTPHVTPLHTPAPSTPSRSQSHAASHPLSQGEINGEAVDKSLLSATTTNDQGIIPEPLATQNGAVGLGIRADSLDSSSPIYSALSKEDENGEDGHYDESNVYADGLEADEEFMDEEDRLIRQGGAGIPIGPVSRYECH
jgi:hypothetical protein